MYSGKGFLGASSKPRKSWAPLKDDSLAVAFADIHGMSFAAYQRQPRMVQQKVCGMVRMNIPLARRATEEYEYSSETDSSRETYRRVSMSWEEEAEMQTVLEEEGYDVSELSSLCM